MAVQDAPVSLNEDALTELGLSGQPFQEDKSRQRFADSTTQRSRAALEQHVRFGDSLHLLLGEDGAGKTVLLSQLIKHCKSSIKPFVVRGGAEFQAVAFLAAVLNQLGGDGQNAQSVDEHIEQLDPLLDDLTDDQYSALLVVDDAHDAPVDEIAELIDIVLHFNSGDSKKVRLLLTGVPKLANTVAGIADQFDADPDDQVNLTYSTNHVQPMDANRTREYLTSRLSQAGHAGAFPFTDKVLAKIHRESSGLPGKINPSAARYINGLYRGGAASDTGRVAAGPADGALRTSGDGGGSWASSLSWPVIGMGALALGLIGIGASMFMRSPDSSQVVVPVADAGVENLRDTVVQPTGSTLTTSPDPVTVADNTIANNGQQPLQEVATQTPALVQTAQPEPAIPLANAPTVTVTPKLEQVAAVAVTPEAAPAATPIIKQPTEVIEQVVDATQVQVPQPAAISTPTALEKDISSKIKVPQSVNVNINTIDSTTVAMPASTSPRVDEVLTNTSSTAAATGVEVDLLDDTDAAGDINSENTLNPLSADQSGEGVAIEAENRAIENERWVLFQSPTKFTVQLATSRDRNYIIELAQTMNVSDPVAIYPFLTTDSQNPVFGLLAGIYDTRAEATAAVDTLDEGTKQFGVWIRPMADLQEDIKRQR